MTFSLGEHHRYCNLSSRLLHMLVTRMCTHFSSKNILPLDWTIKVLWYVCMHMCVCVTERVVSIVCCLNGALSAWTDARPLICAVDELLGHLILPADKVQIFHQTWRLNLDFLTDHWCQNDSWKSMKLLNNLQPKNVIKVVMLAL